MSSLAVQGAVLVFTSGFVAHDGVAHGAKREGRRRPQASHTQAPRGAPHARLRVEPGATNPSCDDSHDTQATRRRLTGRHMPSCTRSLRRLLRTQGAMRVVASIFVALDGIR